MTMDCMKSMNISERIELRLLGSFKKHLCSQPVVTNFDGSTFC